MDAKPVYLSRTFWINLIALGAILYQAISGNELLISPEAQTALLAVINLVLRLITKQPVEWH